jgi:histone H3
MARTKQTRHIPLAKSAKRNARILQKVRNRMQMKKTASAAAAAPEKKARRWRPGTVAKREIRKLTKSTTLLFPKLPFNRLVREICQDFALDMHFTKNSMYALQEAAEMFVTETFHKADIARVHAGRETLNVKDVRFSRFMTPESLWIVPVEKVWEKNMFTSDPRVQPKSKAPARFLDVEKVQKKIKQQLKNKKKVEEARGPAAEDVKEEAEAHDEQAESAEEEEVMQE